ncbi:MAG: tyrosine-type recombinase/integrase [Pseudonocardia sp.]
MPGTGEPQEKIVAIPHIPKPPVAGIVRVLARQLRRHGLRHTGLTWLADAGVPVHVLRKIAGHGSLTTTQRYLHPDSASIAAAGDSLTAFLRAPRSPNGPQLRAL